MKIKISQQALFREAAAVIGALDLEQLFGDIHYGSATPDQIDMMDRVQRYLVKKISLMKRMGRVGG